VVAGGVFHCPSLLKAGVSGGPERGEEDAVQQLPARGQPWALSVSAAAWFVPAGLLLLCRRLPLLSAGRVRDGAAAAGGAGRSVAARHAARGGGAR